MMMMMTIHDKWRHISTEMDSAGLTLSPVIRLGGISPLPPSSPLLLILLKRANLSFL
jgi:hypothetical protein